MEEKRNPIAIIVTRFGDIKVELYPKEAPNTVNCFISLAKKGLFDHRKIRRIAPGFVLQPSYSDFEDERCAISLGGEYRNNGFPNDIPFERGTVAMGGEGNVASGIWESHRRLGSCGTDHSTSDRKSRYWNSGSGCQ